MTLNYCIAWHLFRIAFCVLLLGVMHGILGTDKPWLYEFASHTFVAGCAFRVANHCCEKVYPFV